MTNDKLIHFGPVYGRPVGQSMALCAPEVVSGESRTMTRNLTVTCDRCLRILTNCNEPDAIRAARASGKGGGE